MKKILFFLVTFLFCLPMDAQVQKKEMKDLLLPYHFPSEFVALRDGELAFTKAGSGEKTLIFLHGLSSNADAWYRNMEELSEKYTCYALDLPGFGRSYKEAEVFSPTYFAEVVHEFAEKEGLTHFVLVGHSMGGQAAMKFAELYPGQVDQLVLVAPAGIEAFTPQEAGLIKTFSTPAVFKNTTEEQIDKNYEINFHRMPAEAAQMVQDRKNIREAADFDQHIDAIVKSVHGMLDDPVSADLHKLKIPVLIFFAENDQLIPNKVLHPQMRIADVAALAKEYLPQAEIVMVPESGHFIQFEKPEIVNAAIEKFVGY